MTLDFKRGLKFGAANALIFPAVIALNGWLKEDVVSSKNLIAGAILGFVMFGLIGTLTDKIGSDVDG